MNFITSHTKSASYKGFYLYIIVLLFSISFFNWSCSNDLSKNTIYSFATIETKTDTGEAQTFMIDGNLIPSLVAEKETYYKPYNPRVFIEYYYLNSQNSESESHIKLLRYIYDIMTKNIDTMPSENTNYQDSIGYDKVNIIAGFVEGNYMTLRFNYKISGHNVPHLFSLLSTDDKIEGHYVEKPQKASNEQTEVFPIVLDFRHNAHGDKPNYILPDTYICFNIEDYVKKFHNLPGFSFLVRWTNYEGEMENILLEYR